MKSIREIALTPYYPYGRNKEKIIAERIFEIDEALDELGSVIRADERERVLEVVMTKAKLNYCDYRCGVCNCRYKREDDVGYALNCCERDEIESINEVIEQIKAEQK